jgi:tRNA-dependent cyclodipeptide synthase
LQCIYDINKENNTNELIYSVDVEIDGTLTNILVPEGYSININNIKRILNAKKARVILSNENKIRSITDLKDFIVDYRLISGPKDLIFLTSQKEYITVKTEEITSKAGLKILDLGILPRYKAKTSFVSPVSKRDNFEKTATPFFGISLENGNFVRAKLLASLEWISNRFSKCTVLIGDGIHRITLQVNYGLDEESSIQRALKLGKSFYYNEKHVFERFKSRCEFDFLFCSDIQKSDDYKVYHDYLISLFNNDSGFRSSVRSFGEEYHSKRSTPFTPEEWEKVVNSSCAYFLEEFAIFACLFKNGFSTMVYPGSFSTLSEIAAGLHPQALDELKNLTVVSLHIKKR